MSRTGDYEDDSDYASLNYGRWQHNAQQAMKGKRGQVVLRELEAALLAMPVKQLGEGALVREVFFQNDDGEEEPIIQPCLVGQLAIYKGQSARALLVEVGQIDEEDTWEQQDVTIDAGMKAGLVKTLAEYLFWQNDEYFGYGATPTRRYERALEWVRGQLR